MKSYNFTTEVVYKKAYDISRKGSHPHPTLIISTNSHPKSQKYESKGVKYYILHIRLIS